MNALKNVLFYFIIVGVLFGCSDVGFRSLPSATCTNFNNTQGQTCIVGAGKNSFTVTFHTGDVDILIVNDNSSSMSREQARMADSLQGFLSSISNLYYQIGMITTDVSASKNNGPKAANGNGAFQDGKLLEFLDENGTRSGEFVLTRNTTNNASKFRGTIKRQETLTCDASNYAPASCPSGDERGVYALNLAANRNERGFFRTGAHLAVIVLADEDERSRITLDDGTQKELSGYELEEMDRPESFVENMLEKYPTKTISVHSVIVPPFELGGRTCLTNQTVKLPNGNEARGSVGRVYAELAAPDLFNNDLLDSGNLVGGVIGSICASNYTTQLGDIAAHIAHNASQNVIQMPCAPDANDIHITPSNIPYTVDSQNRLVFSNLPIGSEITVNYLCPANI